MDEVRTVLLDIATRLAPVFSLLAYLVGTIGATEAARETKFYPYVQAFLNWLSRFRKHILFSKKISRIQNLTTGEVRDSSVTAHALFVKTRVPPPGTTWQEGADTYRVVENIDRDLSPVFYVATALVFLTIMFVVGKDLVSFLYLATGPFIRAVTVWGELALDWSIVIIPVRSVLYFLLGIFSMYLLVTLGIGSTLKTVLLFAKWLSQTLTKKTYYTCLALITIVSGGLAQLGKLLE